MKFSGKNVEIFLYPHRTETYGGVIEMMLQFENYRRVFRNRNFLAFWSGFTLSTLGDAMTRVALTWYVFELTNSSKALGLLAIAYTGPVILGGLIAGWMLDRFDRRKVMLIDNILRGAAVILVPSLYVIGKLELWHIYLVAGVYGSLMMISLAGGPTLVSVLVNREGFNTANALETLSFTLSGVIGPPVAGLLIAKIGAPNVVFLDAISYFIFAIALTRIKVEKVESMHTNQEKDRNIRLSDAIRLLATNRILLSTTLMFMAFNIGFGSLNVFLPIYSGQIIGGGPELYGVLLGVMALGEILSASFAGGLTIRKPIGTLIPLAQLISGIVLIFLLLGPQLWWLFSGLFLIGFFSAPLTIWAQTLRMQIIPEVLRGRTFALLRTLMQSTFPVGGATAGFLIPVLGIPGMIVLSAFIIGIPGIIGLRVKELTEADGGLNSPEELFQNPPSSK